MLNINTFVSLNFTLLSDSVKAICLPTGSMANYNFTGRYGIVTGWGITETGSYINSLPTLAHTFMI